MNDSAVMIFNGVLYTLSLVPIGWAARHALIVTESQLLYKGIIAFGCSFLMAAASFFVVGFCGTNSVEWVNIFLVKSRLVTPEICCFSVLAIIYYFYKNKNSHGKIKKK